MDVTKAVPRCIVPRTCQTERIFDETARPLYAVTILGIAIPQDKLDALGHELRVATSQITAAIGGRHPEPATVPS